jgi:hypothetical protein
MTVFTTNQTGNNNVLHDNTRSFISAFSNGRHLGLLFWMFILISSRTVIAIEFLFSKEKRK